MYVSIIERLYAEVKSQLPISMLAHRCQLTHIRGGGGGSVLKKKKSFSATESLRWRSNVNAAFPLRACATGVQRENANALRAIDIAQMF